MSILDKKIETYNGKDVVSSPDILLGTTQENKAVFDRLTKEILVPNFNALIEALSASDGVDYLGATFPGTTLKQLGAVLGHISSLINDRYTKTQSDNLLNAAVSPLVKSWHFNDTNGVITVTHQNGQQDVFDTNIEKIPASLSLVEIDGRVYLKITNDDGSSTQTELSRLLNVYYFDPSDTLIFQKSLSEDDSYHVSARIKPGSVTIGHLENTVMGTITDAMDNAVYHAEQARLSKEQSVISAGQAGASANTALVAAENAGLQASGAEISATSALDSKTKALDSKERADNYQKFSRSYAIGDMGLRPGEEVDNAKYYYEQSKSHAETAGLSSSSASNSATGAVSAKKQAEGFKVAAESSALQASSSENTAVLAQITATEQAGIATEKANLATQKATEAVSSADSAADSAEKALTYKDLAEYWAGQAGQIVGGDFAVGATLGGDPVLKENQVLRFPAYPLPYIHPSSHPASMIAEDVNRLFMTESEREKLGGIAEGANKYIHPDSHLASMIEQDAENRLVSDAKIDFWNGKTDLVLVEEKDTIVLQNAKSYAEGLISVIDGGDFATTADIASHNADAMAHLLLNVDGNANGIVKNSTLNEHMENTDSHQNIHIDGNRG